MVNNNILLKSEETNEVAGAQSKAMASGVVAQIQGQIFMAKQYPRNYSEIEKKIENSCLRLSLAKCAEYEYSRGGQTVTGASIKLMEVIAQIYGNIKFGWKEFERGKEKTKAISYAWDMENNTYQELEFEVALKRDKTDKKTNTKYTELLTSERDIYELIASNAQRRVRKCLESVIPRDLVEDAREQCKTTLTAKIDIKAGIDKAISFFENEYGVSLERIEKKFGISYRGFTSNTYVRLQGLYQSIKDGVATADELFPDDNPKLKNNIKNEEKKETVNEEIKEEKHMTVEDLPEGLF